MARCSPWPGWPAPRQATRDAILGIIRAPISPAFMALLLFWTFAFAAGANVLTAAAFGLGTAIGGFETVALRGTAIALSGALGRFLVDHNAWFPARTRGCWLDFTRARH